MRQLSLSSCTLPAHVAHHVTRHVTSGAVLAIHHYTRSSKCGGCRLHNERLCVGIPVCVCDVMGRRVRSGPRGHSSLGVIYKELSYKYTAPENLDLLSATPGSNPAPHPTYRS